MTEAHNPNVTKPQRVLVVGLGTMGMSHARAYQAIDGFELVGYALATPRGAAISTRSSLTFHVMKA
jgi:hypothetical protein